MPRRARDSAAVAVSRRISRALAGFVHAATAYARPWRRAQLRLLVSEQLHQRHRVETSHGTLVFVSTHARTLETPREFFRSEPETLRWIDGFAPGTVLWDIGANVGAYSLYAGLRGDLDVLAFEPSATSYAALCTNIAMNGLGRVQAYCLALSDRTRLGTLNLSRAYPGSVHNAFEQEVDMTGTPLNIERRQAVLGISADDLVEIFAAPAPHHIKLDVDSAETAILRGAARLLRSPALLSVLVENAVDDTAQNRAIDQLLTEAGFHPASRGRGGSDVTVNLIYRR
jgi:FkbM family methyltransferase